jgi:arylsulfatase A-like enzyme
MEMAYIGLYKKLILLGILLIVMSALFISCKNQTGTDPDQRPNVLLVFTDQQNINMISASGNPYLNTPAIDRLAHQGVMFMQSYCTSPVCGPARSSIITGRMPHETGVEWNGDVLKDDIVNAGEIFRTAGYQTVWAGKWHLPESYPQRAASKQKKIKGFEILPFYEPEVSNWMLGSETDPPLTEAVVDFLKNYNTPNPFFLAISYHNPHDICFYPRKDGWVSKDDSLLEIRHYGFKYRLPDVIGINPDYIGELPPLPDNHSINEDEPEFIRQKRTDHDEYGTETKLANMEFSEKEWRGYYHAYCRLTEIVDREIGKVLNALSENGFDRNTIIIFTSDHGDGAASHKWAAKLSLYEESSKIPLIISWPDRVPEGVKDSVNLVSQIDILPTLCDYAGIKTSVKFTGRSLRPVIEVPGSPWRNYLVVELADFKPDPQRKGRMLRTADYKYNVYTQGKRNEQFFNIKTDPGETSNLINDPDYREEIDHHKEMLKEWFRESNDTYEF